MDTQNDSTDDYPEFEDRAITISYRADVRVEKVLQYEEIAREAWERGDAIPETDDEIAGWVENHPNSIHTDLFYEFDIEHVVDVDQVEVKS